MKHIRKSVAVIFLSFLTTYSFNSYAADADTAIFNMRFSEMPDSQISLQVELEHSNNVAGLALFVEYPSAGVSLVDDSLKSPLDQAALQKAEGRNKIDLIWDTVEQNKGIDGTVLTAVFDSDKGKIDYSQFKLTVSEFYHSDEQLSDIKFKINSKDSKSMPKGSVILISLAAVIVIAFGAVTAYLLTKKKKDAEKYELKQEN